MKKLSIVLLLVMFLVGCSNGSKNEDIMVYSRDEASGTRQAFEEIVGIENLTEEAAIVSSNGDMASQVGQNKHGIGYVSLSTDFEKNNLKGLTYEGVEPTIENVIKGDYSLARPFNFVTRGEDDFENEDIKALTLAFIDFLTNSKEGRQMVLSEGGIVDVEAGIPWEELKVNHPIVDQDNSSLLLKTGGSTSVVNTLTAALEAFQPLAGNFKFEMNHTGSSDAFKRTLGDEKDSPNRVDIGFASRDFKSEEDIAKGLLYGEYAKDAVVVVVQKDHKMDGLTATEVKDIFEGKLTSWES